MDSRNLHTELQSVRNRTIEMLRNRPRELTYERIARETGLNVDWVKHMLRENASKNPRPENLCTLHDYLSKHVETAWALDSTAR